MDRRENSILEEEKKVYGPSTADSISENQTEKGYITENGVKVRLPYRMIKKVTITGLDQKELIDIPHTARLQYRLLLFDAVIKAKIEFVKKRMYIIYNNPEADNAKEKMSLQQLTDFLAKEGVHIKPESTKVEDYDYYKQYYSTTFFPESIREAPPYGWTREQWAKEKIRVQKLKEKMERKTAHSGIIGKLFKKKSEPTKASGKTNSIGQHF